jgi:hypothetical protein
MRDLFQRVYPGIGAPGTDQVDRVIGDESQRGFKILLDRIAVRLTLPPTICSTRILDTNRVFHSRAVNRSSGNNCAAAVG